MINKFPRNVNQLSDNQREDLYKKWLDAGITQHLLFNKSMRLVKFCKPLLESIFDKKIEKIDFIEYEKVLHIDIGTKGIRLDIVFEDDRTVYNIEMQATNTHNLPKRSDMYHAILTVASSSTGGKYNESKNTAVIFFCDFDLFELDEPRYEFEYYCKKSNIHLGDGTKRIFFNAKAYKKEENPHIRGFLALMRKDKSEYDTLAHEIDSYMQQLKGIKDLEDNFMEMTLNEYYQHIDDLAEGEKKGIVIGEKQGIKKGIAIGREEATKETSINIAKQLLDILDDESIAQRTSLSLAEVKKLREAN